MLRNEGHTRENPSIEAKETSGESKDVYRSHQYISECPHFLYCSKPCFPWSPRLDDTRDCLSEEDKSGKCKTVLVSNSFCNTNTNEDYNNFLVLIRTLHDKCNDIGKNEADEKILLDLRAIVQKFGLLSEVYQQKFQWEDCASFSSDNILFFVQSLVNKSSEYILPLHSAKLFIIPTVLSLKSPAPTPLYAAVKHLGQSNGEALLEGCILPLYHNKKGIENKFVSELVLRCINEGLVPVARTPALISVMSQHSSLWKDHNVLLLQAILRANDMPLNVSDVESLTAAIHNCASTSLKGSLKLAKLLLTLIKGWGINMPESWIHSARQTAQACGTFMSKAVLTALDEIETFQCKQIR